MKKIEAVIREERLEDVKKALEEKNFGLISGSTAISSTLKGSFLISMLNLYALFVLIKISAYQYDPIF